MKKKCNIWNSINKGLLIILIFSMILVSSYSVDISSCQTLNANTEYNLVSNITNHNNDCFIFGGDNIVFNGNHFLIDGQSSGEAFTTNNNGRSNITIKDVFINDFDEAFRIRNSDNFLLENIVSTSNDNYGFRIGDANNGRRGCDNCIFRNISLSDVGSQDGVFYELSSDVVFSNLSLTSIGNGNNDYGLYFNEVSNVDLDIVDIYYSRDTGIWFEDGNNLSAFDITINRTTNSERDAFTIRRANLIEIENFEFYNIAGDLFDFDFNVDNVLVSNGFGTSNNQNGFEFRYNVTNVLIDNVSLFGISRGLYCEDDNVNSCENISISNMIINETTDDGIYVENADHLVITNSIFKNIGNGGDQGIQMYRSSYVHIENVSISGNINEGIYGADEIHTSIFKNIFINQTNQEGIELVNDAYSNYLENITIMQSLRDGIDITNSGHNTTIIGAKIYDVGNGDGIRISNSANNTYLEDIYIQGPSDDGIELNINPIFSYLNNITIVNVGDMGIVCEDGSGVGCQFSNFSNILINSTGTDDGIFLDDSSHVSLVNISLFDIGDSGDQGIYLTYADNCHLENIFITGTLQEAIYGRYSMDNCIFRNITSHATLTQEGFEMRDGSSHNIFEDIFINQTGTDGIELLSPATNNSFENIYLPNVGNGDGIRLINQPLYSSLRNIYIQGANNDGIEISNNASYSLFENITIHNVRLRGIYCEDGSGLGCSNSIFRTIEIINTTSDDALYIQDAPNLFVEDIYVENIGGDSSGDYVLYTSEARNSTFRNIVGVNVGDGIFIDDNSYGSLFENILLDGITNGSYAYRIDAQSHNATLKNISIYNITRNPSNTGYGVGMYISNSDFVSIDEIYINGTDNDGLILISSFNSTLENIYLSDIAYTSPSGVPASSQGLFLASNSHNSFINNVFIDGVGDIGIYIDAQNVTLNNIDVSNTNDDLLFTSDYDPGFELVNFTGRNSLSEGVRIGINKYTTLVENVFIENVSLNGFFHSTRAGQHAVFRNISVLNSGSASAGIWIYGDDFSIFEDLFVDQSGLYGIRIEDAQESIFRNFYVNNTLGDGIYLDNVDNSEMHSSSSNNNVDEGLFFTNSNGLNLSYLDLRFNGDYNLEFSNSVPANISFSHLGEPSKTRSNNWNVESLWNISYAPYGLGNYWSNEVCRSARSVVYNSYEYYVCTSDDVVLNAPNSRIDYAPLIYPEYDFAINYTSPTPANNSLTCGILDVNISIGNTLEHSSILSLNQDVIGFYSFDTALDLFGLGPSMSFQNGAFISNATRVRGDYLELDGVNDYVSLGDVAEVDGAEEFSASAWIRPDSLTSDDTILSKGQFSTGQPLIFWRDDDGAVFGRTDTISVLISDGFGDARIEGSTNAVSNLHWHHVAFTFKANDPQGLRLYINGVEDVNSPVSTLGINYIEPSASPLQIGRPTTTSGKEFDGGIDDVVLVERTLSSEEIESLYHSNLYNFDHNYSLDPGNYTYSVCATNYNGLFNCTDERTIIVSNNSISNFTQHSPVGKYFSPELVYANFTSDVILSNVSFYLDGISSQRYSMFSGDGFTWEAPIMNLTLGIHNITFAYYSGCGIEEIMFGGDFYYITNESIYVNKSISYQAPQLYFIEIDIINQMNKTQNFTLYDFVEENSVAGSFSPLFTHNDVIGSPSQEYRGDIYYWNFSLHAFESRSFNYSISTPNNSSLTNNFIFGVSRR